MRKRLAIDILTALTLVIWLNVVASALVPRFAEAVKNGEWCDPALSNCQAFANGCGQCVPTGQVGGCTEASWWYSCLNGAGTCADGTGCSCNPSAC